MQIYKGFGLDMPYGVVSAKVNNHVEGLNFRVYHNKDVEFLDISSESGLRTYVRSLCFVLCKAVADVFPDGQILLEHPVSRGYYCSLRIGREPELADVTRIKQRMAEIIAADLPFHRIEQHSEEAIRLFEQKGMTDKVKLLRTTGRLYTYYYTLDGFVDYYYGSLLPSTGHLHLFDLVKYYDGLLLRFPDRMNPSVLGEMVKQEKMFDVFNENRRWQEIMGVSTVGDFNEAIAEGHATDLINVAEALQEKRIARIADDICARPDVKVVLISGPSSSGKTTFSKRLSVQLMANGKRPHPISLDNYFVDRQHTPLDADGNYDYESLMGTTFGMNKKQRIQTFSSGSSHAMTLMAVDLDKNGKPVKWMVENSWGADSGYKGHLIMTDDWFDEYMFRLVVETKYVPAKIMELFKQKPGRLPAWDPMFAEAKEIGGSDSC